jgi:branched-chain amino acid transport system permease protein
MDAVVIQTVNGIVNGMILALVASGLTLIFGIMEYQLRPRGSRHAGASPAPHHHGHHGNFWLALLAAAIVIAVFGRALRSPPCARSGATLHRILATFGISLVLQRYACGRGRPRKIQEPITGQFTMFYLQYPWYRIATAILAAAIIGSLYAFLRYAKYGIWIRATTQDRIMAAAMGIPVPLVHTGVFAIGAGMAAMSGVLFGPLGGVTQNMGFDFTLRAFIVVVVGGMGNLGGSILASIFISLLEAYASLVVSPAQAVIVSFVALILTLLFRPTGLFVPTPK